MKMKHAINEFAVELSMLIGQHIGPDHIHPSTGRFYYIQMPKTGSPMLLHHYRGPFFVDMNPVDYDRIDSGEVSPHEYIYKANWLVGYYWGGGSMIGGGYYQPMDIIGRNDQVRRYLKILACRGSFKACGYMPSSDECLKCDVIDCPFSLFSQGDWAEEMEEDDPRIDLFNHLVKRFQSEYAPYSIRGFLCGSIPDNEVWFRPNSRYTDSEEYSFTCYVSENLIEDLLMRKICMTEYDVSILKFMLRDVTEEKCLPVNQDTLNDAFKKVDYVNLKEDVPLKRIINFFRRMF
jgi:hypothetical protein